MKASAVSNSNSNCTAVLYAAAKSLGGLLLSLLVLSLIIFLLSRLLPGSPLNALIGDHADMLSAEQSKEALAALGFDRPLYAQYLSWLGSVLQGNLGFSLYYKMQVNELLPPLLINTLILGGISYILIFALALILAVICIRFEESLIDRLICKAGSLCYFLPSFWLCLLLILIFSVSLQWLPSSGAYSYARQNDVLDRVQHLILPCSVMILSHMWYYGSILRNRLSLEVRMPYVLTAKASGMGSWRILTSVCLRAALPLLVNLMAVSAAHIIGGTYVVEAVFNYPGIGNAAVLSAKNHDYDLLLVLTLLTGSFIILAAIAARFLSALADPRLKAAKQGALR